MIASDPNARVDRSNPVRVLVVEDTPEFLEMIAVCLRDEGFRVDTAVDGRRAIEIARAIEPEVVILDLGLPQLDGVEVCRQIRTFSDAYVVMLTGRDDEVDKLIGLSVGADDYMTKPFSPRELVARLRAILRRSRTSAEPSRRRFGELSIDPLAREVTVEGAGVELTRLEFDLLDVLSARPKVVFTRQQLLQGVWGEDWVGDDHVVDVHLSTLRRKLGDDPKAPRYITTVRGVGYRFAEPVSG